MGMKLPIKHVYVVRQRWDVVPVASFPDETQVGECDSETRELKIKASIHKEAILETIVHEAVHAYQEINYMDTAWGNPDRRHEYLAQWTTVLIMDFVRGNPELVKKLLAK